MTDPAPMDADRLAQLRADLKRGRLSGPIFVTIEDLLAAHDYWRARCPVTAEDIERVGLTRDDVAAWLTAQGWVASPNETTVRMGRPSSEWAASLVTWRAAQRGQAGVSVPDTDALNDLLEAVDACAFHFERPAQDILDEMAATRPAIRAEDVRPLPADDA